MIIYASFDINDPELWVNRGLSYGDGVFETMRLKGRDIPLFELHMHRLNSSLKQLKLDRFDSKMFENSVLKNLADGQDAIIKLIVFRGNQQRTYTPKTQQIEWFVTLEQLPELSFKQPLRLQICQQTISHQPNLAGMKHLSRLEQVLLAAELNELKGVDDLLICDHQTHIIETTCQNIVLIKNKQLITPKLEQAGVHGVALQWLQAQQNVKSETVYMKDLMGYQGMMVCNSIRGFSRVKSVTVDKKQCISFGTSADIHDKISSQWDALFNS